MDGNYKGRGRVENFHGRQGRSKKKLTEAQAALIFQLQVEIRAARLLIDRILDEAGYSQCRGSRSTVRSHVWLDRGRVGITRRDSRSGK